MSEEWWEGYKECFHEKLEECKKGNHEFMPCGCPFEGSECMWCKKPKGDASVKYWDK